MERIDDTGFGGYRVIRGEGFGYGVDSVLLAAFAAGETGAAGIATGNGGAAKIADLGTGNGVIPFILAHKIPTAEFLGVEFQEHACELARRGAVLNGLQDRVHFLCRDVKALGEQIGDGEAEDLALRYDAVVSNPPYFRRGCGIANEEAALFAARHETTAELLDFLRCAAGLLHERGDFYMVHRPSRLVDILSAMREAGLEPKELQLVVPREGAASNILLVHGVKGAGRELRLLPQIVVHGEDGGYTSLIERIYERDACPLRGE